MLSFFDHIMDFSGLSFHDLAKLAGELVDVGLPPKVKDEGKFREWVARLISFLRLVVEKTKNEFDNRMVVLLNAALSDDQGWEAFYGLLTSLWDGVTSVYAVAPAVEVLERKTGFDAALIMEIVRKVRRIVDWFNG